MWNLANLHFFTFLNFAEDMPLISMILNGIDPSIYKIQVSFEYDSGSLYDWAGTIYYSCGSGIIAKTERQSLNLIYRNLRIGDGALLYFHKIDKQTGLKEEIMSLRVGYNGSYIPLSLIDRYGLPAQGENINKPYN